MFVARLFLNFGLATVVVGVIRGLVDLFRVAVGLAFFVTMGTFLNRVRSGVEPNLRRIDCY